jgi:hypothetical protein
MGKTVKPNERLIELEKKEKRLEELCDGLAFDPGCKILAFDPGRKIMGSTNMDST